MNRPHMTRRGILGTTTLVFGVLTSAGHGGGEVFESLNVDLLSQIPLNGFASNPSTASDCWGYVSPSGREYALVALRNALAVVEVTDPVLIPGPAPTGKAPDFFGEPHISNCIRDRDLVENCWAFLKRRASETGGASLLGPIGASTRPRQPWRI